jgi:Ca2+-transporting ATPase
MADAGIIYMTATTMSLAGIVTSQVGNVFACRTDRESVFRAGFFANKLVLWGIAAELAIITALIYTPFLQKIFGLAPLAIKDWALLIVFAPILLVVEEGRKWLFRNKSRPS